MRKEEKYLFVIAAALFLLGSVNSFAGALDKVQFIKISPQDEKAVVKGADGKLQVVKPGDAIGESLKVKEIVSGRIVLEEKTDKGMETVIVRLEKGKQRLERLRSQPDKGLPMLAPVPIQK